ncbi:MAG: 4-alpha-glucanotransferase [Desulfobacterota bacterium]|nr:4-alpha-glucanotransferase [Thermodesulfobacteriota bacterium]
MLKQRGSGVLLHFTSLPSPFGIGDFGPWAYRFADFLAQAKQSYWQCLPLNPTEILHGNSPYHSMSAFGFNPLLISPELLVQEGILSEDDLQPLPSFSRDRVDFGLAVPYKHKLLTLAYDRFRNEKTHREYRDFCSEHASWLDDFALFVALKEEFQGRPWNEWPDALRDRDPEALRHAKERRADRIQEQKFFQFLFFKQWSSLKKYCTARGIQVIGDVPIYVVHDSADVWRHPDLFHLDRKKQPVTVAGVPPDYFSKTGQLWGNPVYRWEALQSTGYEWWMERIRHNLNLFDVVRVDHFRGFMAYWEVPANETVAVNGQWVDAPGMDFFGRLTAVLPHPPILAEDLGTITPDVWAAMEHFGFPGMKVLLFAFDESLPRNAYAPHHHTKNAVVYTGTHDNNTARAWFEKEADEAVRGRLSRYIGREITADNVHRELIRLAMMSVADTAILPMQDLLGLGEWARMNRPARQEGNWQWRLVPEQVTAPLAKELLEWTELYGRSNGA